MQIQRLNRSDGEKIFMTFRNSDATPYAAGHWAAFDMVTDQDGVGVDKPAGYNRNKIAGVCMQTLAPGAYGQFQVWGINTIARAKGSTRTATSALNAGAPLVIATSGFYPTRFPITSAAAKADYAKQGAIGYAGAPHTAAQWSAATSATYTVFITCL